jgi:O-succinylbenzoic acid--CoA ligase
VEFFGQTLPHLPDQPVLVSAGRAWVREALEAEVADRAEARARDGSDGRVVPLVVPPDARGVIDLLAVWASGRVAAPLSPQLSTEERGQAMRTLRESEERGDIPSGTAAVLWTSGTSGRPRGVALGFPGLREHADATVQRLALAPADVWLASLSPAHVGGLALITRALLLGCTLVAEGRFRVETAVAALNGESGTPPVTHLSLVPTQFLRLLEAWGDAPPPPGLRCVLLGGTATPAPLLRRALDAGWPVALTYGMTEAGSQVATADPERVRAKPGAVGRPLDGVEVQLAPDDEILVRGPTLALGLVGSGDALTDAEGWYHSGDLGRVDADGDLWITGRKSDRILSGGVTVDPHEVEAVLREHPRVRDACVVGIPDPEWGERVGAVVVPEGPPSLDSLGALSDWASARLGPARRPRLWTTVPALPLNRNGKVDRSAVRRMLADSPPAV